MIWLFWPKLIDQGKFERDNSKPANSRCSMLDIYMLQQLLLEGLLLRRIV